MGWVTSRTDPDPPPDVVLRVCGPDRFQLLTPYGYRDPSGRYFGVPAQSGDPYRPGNSTDLASVPPPLWGLLASYGHQLRAALLHDHLCSEIDDADQGMRSPGASQRAAAYENRWQADEVFRLALADSAVPWFRRWLFWCGVALARYFLYRRPAFVVLICQIAASVAAVVVGVVMLLASRPVEGTPYAWLVVVVLLGASALWRRDWPLVLLGSVACLPVCAVWLLGVTTQALLSMPDYLIWLVSRGRTPPPTLHPYVRRFPLH